MDCGKYVRWLPVQSCMLKEVETERRMCENEANMSGGFLYEFVGGLGY